MADQALFVEQQIEIFDDDDFGLSLGRFPIFPRFDLLTSAVIDKYKPAYITLDDVESLGLNVNKVVTFRSNDEAFDKQNAMADNLRVHAYDKDWWSVLLVAAYQGLAAEDWDPQTHQDPQTGEFKPHWAPQIPGFANIYLEGLRKVSHGLFQAGLNSQGMNLFSLRLDNNVAHEIGHGPLGQGNKNGVAHHAEGGVMSDGALGAQFEPSSLIRFRETNFWRR